MGFHSYYDQSYSYGTMNVIPLVMIILFILSYGAAASLQTRLLTYRNQKAHVALQKAELSILRKSEKKQFNLLQGVKVKKEKKKSTPRTNHTAKPVNAPCARLNLYPLLVNGRETHPALYETAAKMLRLFYQNSFPSEKKFEYKMLDAIIAGAKEKGPDNNKIALETIVVQDLQPLYYRLLKGTKRYQLSVVGYPPLTDYWKIEKEQGKICLFHCNLDMLTLFFGTKTALKLFEEIHDKTKKSLSIEGILDWGTDPQLRFVDKQVWDLIDFKRPQHRNGADQTIIVTKEGVTIRKDISL